ncbi:trimethylamine methyltransferase family protein, partial [Desulfobacula sp.]|uniref:trimethylamine methyltransferase family protein n=1 Tax=Desulfobacula sp. TaxID=2593537 RepID=UPI002714F48C
LTDPHTLMNFKKNWQPDLTDRKTRNIWQKNGSSSMGERAKEKIKLIIETHIPDPMDDKVVQKIHTIIELAKTRYR